jgi:hypothetical protein
MTLGEGLPFIKPLGMIIDMGSLCRLHSALAWRAKLAAVRRAGPNAVKQSLGPS